MTKNSQRFAACEPTLFQPMKQYRLPSLFLASATLAWAVPAQINYQGRLTDANGDPVTGEVTMSLKLFDAAEGGAELYAEEIGSVTLNDNGVYSFPFGADGQSVVATSESITSTDGVNQVFNATLANLPVDGSVSLSDGTYTWSQVDGSSSVADFTASVTPANGAVSAIYLSGAPAAGVEITANYDYLDATVVGALSSHESHWLELSVDGSAQSPRERVLSVPFAHFAAYSNETLSSSRTINYVNQWEVTDNTYGWYDPDNTYTLPIAHNSSGGSWQDDVVAFSRHIRETWASKITNVRVLMAEYTANPSRLANPSVEIRLRRYSVSGGTEDILELNTNVDDSDVEKIYSTESGFEVPLDFENYSYFLTAVFRTGGTYKSGGGILKSVKITYAE